MTLICYPKRCFLSFSVRLLVIFSRWFTLVQWNYTSTPIIFVVVDSTCISFIRLLLQFIDETLIQRARRRCFVCCKVIFWWNIRMGKFTSPDANESTGIAKRSTKNVHPRRHFENENSINLCEIIISTFSSLPPFSVSWFPSHFQSNRLRTSTPVA